MTKGDIHLRGLALREQNREFFETLPKAKGYTKREVIGGYVKAGIFVLELPLVAYCILKGVLKQRRRRAQRARDAAAV